MLRPASTKFRLRHFLVEAGRRVVEAGRSNSASTMLPQCFDLLRPSFVCDIFWSKQVEAGRSKSKQVEAGRSNSASTYFDTKNGDKYGRSWSKQVEVIVLRPCFHSASTCFDQVSSATLFGRSMVETSRSRSKLVESLLLRPTSTQKMATKMVEAGRSRSK